MQKAGLRGRATQCRAIINLIDEAASGTGGALLLHGELGLGKTTLLDQGSATATAHPAGFTVLAAKGLPDEATLPYAVLHRLLEPLVGQLPLLPTRQTQVLTRALTGEGCPEPDQLVLCQAVLGLLGTASAEQPLFCRLDDVPAADPPSLDVLAFAARRLRPYRVAMLFTSEVSATISDVPALQLTPLDPADSLARLADLIPDGLPGDAATTLARLARGNPQALTDLAVALTPAQRYGEEPLPTALPLDGVLGRSYRDRLRRLPTETRWLLLLAAADDVLDQPGLVRAAVASGTALSALAPAELAGLIRVDDQGVNFSPQLLRALVYRQAPLARRRTAHLLLARIIDTGPEQRLRRAVHLAAAADGPDEPLATELEQAAAAPTGTYATASAALERAAQLSDARTSAGRGNAANRLMTAARYAWLAGNPQRAHRLLFRVRAGGTDRAVQGRAWLLSGEMALRAGAAGEALDCLLTAAESLAPTDRQLALEALLRAGEAVSFSGEYHRYAEIARRAAGLRQPGAPDAVLLAQEHIAGSAAAFQGHHHAAAAHLRRAVTIATRSTDPAGLTVASVASLLAADDVAARNLASRAVARARASGDVSMLPRALELLSYAHYWCDPTGTTAVAAAQEGLTAAWESGQENSADNHRGMLAVLAAIRGDRAGALRHGQFPAGTQPERQRPWALRQWALAVLDLIDGRSPDAAARLHSLAQPGTGSGQLVVQVMATPYLIEAVAHSGAAAAVAPSVAAVSGLTPGSPTAVRARAVRALAVFDRWASGTGNPGRRAVSARCHALLAPRGGGVAEDYFREALHLHAAGGADFDWARTELLFGQELRRSRRPRAAREHLHRAAETFQRLGVPVWTQQAMAELRAAGATVPAPTVDVRTLTAQQLRIARLVVEGATNREVAARLHLSPRTIDHHMRNIFHRLGLRSRMELARVLR
ncbi:LuxR family transcriptional regulator [Micromonospora polyrhachis]|uniref:DNA-binding CsgD family transcriptional regulator n=1 Tax=Micromonospora polyrhachis TaxID=1282883 RepID=A0A7W7SK90_9ACTN|nr:helix-turn-helix transcriptional regulator [Micromonospora polyrhachis]MBB4956338.1 DNA-binding CsgD family transcriptional regulator [Micromonospora polyrhachis]